VFHFATQGYRVWKFEREEGERSVNFRALSLRSWSGFDVFRPLRDETDPNAIPLFRYRRHVFFGAPDDNPLKE